MLSITALLHTFNNGLTLGRALETLHPCDEILIVDRHSHDATLRIAREYGARVVPFSADAPPSLYLQHATCDSIFCLEPRESLSEALAASLYEWKSLPHPDLAIPCNVFLRQETAGGWIDLPLPETRLVPKSWTDWQGWLPLHAPSATALDGPLLRFRDRRHH
jgi:glycosyltransferase involved in cell wall biosynthesis